MEMEGLTICSLWKKMKRTETDRNCIIISGRLINNIKNYGRAVEVANVRYIPQEYNDKLQPYFVRYMAHWERHPFDWYFSRLPTYQFTTF